MWNGDIEVSICKPSSRARRLLPQRRGRRGHLRPPRRRRAADRLRQRAVPRAGLRRDPARHHPHVRARRAASRPGSASTRPARSRRPTATATATACCSSTRPTRSATSTRRPSSRPCDESGEFEVTVRVRDGYQDYMLDRHPFDVVGWDGYVWPYTFNADDFEPRAGRFHLPPPAHQTFQGPNFVICTFARGCSTGIPRRCRFPTTTRTSSPRRSCSTPTATTRARKGVDVGLDHPAPVRPAARAAAGRRREGARRQEHRRAGGDVGHLPAAAAHHALARPRQARVRALVEPRPPRRWGPMFEEGQLYSPVTQREDGVVRSTSAHDHPGFNDPAVPRAPQRDRRGRAGLDARASRSRTIDYTEREHEIWRIVCRELARQARALRVPRVPRRGRRARPARGPRPAARRGHRPACEPLTGFDTSARPGLVPLDEFYGSLADRVFHSTQYVRHSVGAALHARAGHDPRGDRPREHAGEPAASPSSSAWPATRRAASRPTRRLQFIADVFWFTLEFGVIREDGELRGLRRGHPLELRRDRGVPRHGDPPARLRRDGTVEYDITQYQPILFAAESMDHLDGRRSAASSPASTTTRRRGWGRPPPAAR